MATDRSSLKRKPLADCTNTIPGREATVRRKLSLRSAVTTLPPRSFSENNYEAPTGSLKSNTSTGSNNTPILTPADSTLLIASRGSENQEIERTDRGKAVVEDATVFLSNNENYDARKRKDKGKEVVEDTTLVLLGNEKHETKKRKGRGKVVFEDSTTGFGHEKKRKYKGKAVVEDTKIVFGDENQEAERRKDKGKAVVEDTTIVFGNENQETERRKDKGKAVMEDTFGDENQEAERRKDKGKAVVEDTTIVFGNENQETERRKDKGKAVMEDITFVLGARDNFGTNKWKDKGKAVVEDTFVQPNPQSPLSVNLSSATLSDSIYPDRSKCKTVYTRKRVPEARTLRSVKITEPLSCPPVIRLKDKGKQVADGEGDGKSGRRRNSYPAHKKQSRVKPKHGATVDAMPKEEVEKLSAYYKELDAFELPVEEAKGSDSD